MSISSNCTTVPFKSILPIRPSIADGRVINFNHKPRLDFSFNNFSSVAGFITSPVQQLQLRLRQPQEGTGLDGA